MSTLTLIYPLIGLGALFIVPFIFHLFMFNKSRGFQNIITSILVGEYILTSYCIIFGLLGMFDGGVILLTSILTALIIVKIIKMKKICIPMSASIPKKVILLTIGFIIFMYLREYYRLFTFSYDALHTYLPWARIIVNTSSIPPTYFENNIQFYVGLQPLLYTRAAYLFSLFGTFEDSIISSIPIFYTSITMLVLFTWISEFDKNITPSIVIIPLLVSISFMEISINLYQEAPLLFFVTCSLYFIFKFFNSKETNLLLLTILSIVLSMATKYTGFAIATILYLFLLIKSNWSIRKKVIIYSFILSSPLLLWHLRNYYFFNNPFFTFFSSIFKGNVTNSWNVIKESIKTISINNKRNILDIIFSIRGEKTSSLVFNYMILLKNTIILFPASIFSFYYIVKNFNDLKVKITLFSFLYMFFLIPFFSWTSLKPRFLYPFYGVLSVYASIIIINLLRRFPLKIIRKNVNSGIRTFAILGIISILFFPSFLTISSLRYPPPFLKHYKSYEERFGEEWEILEYIEENEDKEDIRIFGEKSNVLIWYGNCTILRPNSLLHNGNRLLLKGDSRSYWEVFKYIHVLYVFDSPKNVNDEYFVIIDKDKKHFELVFDKNGYKLWKVVP